MMIRLLLKLAKDNWQNIASTVALICFGYWLAVQPYKTKLAQLETVHAQAKENWEAERKSVVEDYSRTLEFEVEKLQRASAENQRVTVELASIKQQLNTTKNKLKRSINHVTKNDGTTYTGLGASGLLLYRSALGYATATNSQCLPTDTSGTTTNASKAICPSTGLSPDDLLAHSADYGEYCQQLEQQLRAIRDWETNK